MNMKQTGKLTHHTSLKSLWRVDLWESHQW